MNDEKETHEVFYLEPSKLFTYLQDMLEDKRQFTEEDIRKSLVVMTYNEIDYDLANRLCEKFIHSKNENIRNLAIMGVGHIARVYKKLVSPTLYQAAIDIYKRKGKYKSYTESSVEDAASALHNIEYFLKILKPPRDE